MLTSKLAPDSGDANLNRILQRIYYDINEIIVALPSSNTSLIDQSQGRTGEVRVAMQGNDDFIISVKSTQGWVNSLSGVFTFQNKSLKETLLATISGIGVQTINGMNNAAQLIIVGSSGTDFNIVSVAGTVTLNLPTASSVNRGLLSTTDWSAFNALVSGSVPITRTLTAGTGLTGGGDLSANRTFAVTGNLATLYALANAVGWLHNDGAGALAWSTPAIPIRCGSTALTANTDTVITFSTALSGTVHAVPLSCKDASGAIVEVTISGETTTNFHANCPVNSTLVWLGVSET